MSLLKKSYKYIIGIILIGLFILTLVLINKYNDENNKASDTGYITVLVNNIDNEIVSKKRIEYEENDTLFDLIDSNYDLIYENSTYGHYILGFDDLNIKTDGLTTWIWLEVAYLKDGHEYADDINFNHYEEIDVNYGIDGLEIKDNMIIGFNERDGNTNTSMFESAFEDVNPNDNSINRNTYIIFGIILFSLIVIIFIVLLIVNRKSSTLTVKEMCILSFMSIILFVQEQVLSFIPNFQFTFMLIALYASIFGIKKASMIVLVHVILDNLFMGSFNIVTILPMLIGYELTIILVYVVRNKKLIHIVLMVILASLIYCMCFLVVNAIMLDINVFHYFIADIPFEILLIISNIFTTLWFYRPLEKCIRDNYNKIIQK